MDDGLVELANDDQLKQALEKYEEHREIHFYFERPLDIPVVCDFVDLDLGGEGNMVDEEERVGVKDMNVTNEEKYILNLYKELYSDEEGQSEGEEEVVCEVEDEEEATEGGGRGMEYFIDNTLIMITTIAARMRTDKGKEKIRMDKGREKVWLDKEDEGATKKEWPQWNPNVGYRAVRFELGMEFANLKQFKEAACKSGWIVGCRLVIGLDDCFLKGYYDGSALGQDEDRGFYPIAITVVDKETSDTLSWFVTRLVEDLGSDVVETWTFILDRQKAHLGQYGQGSQGKFDKDAWNYLADRPPKLWWSAMGCNSVVPEEYVSHYFNQDMYLAAYEPHIQPISGEDLWEKSGKEAPLPPKLSRPAGRPKASRTKEA
ncbi:hypothetical protein L6164_017109 [Bauhinia variegata]|uniref:Uncharacterized protein n=1 Tax=Bauhinia variegata TaxID=167791 RepID=A0ACB9N8V3_BAUVA|nr:hypothetical protein L6164_017109 [Bauhinia variegata]